MRLSLREKLLGLIAGLLLAAMAAYFWLAAHLFEQDKKAYLNPPPNAPWKGFKPRTAVGLTLEHADAAAPSR